MGWSPGAAAASLSPDQLLFEGQGLVAESMPRYDAVNASLLVSGDVYYTGLPLYAGDVATNLLFQMTTAASGLTLCRAGIYSAALELLASSADVSSAFEGPVGVVTCPLSEPFEAPSSGFYYAALLAVGTTPPTVQRNSGLNQWQVGTAPKAYGLQTGQSDLPASGLTSASAGLALWVGVT